MQFFDDSLLPENQDALVMVKIAEQLWHPVASTADARRIYKIGQFYARRRRDAREERLAAQRRTPPRPVARSRLNRNDSRDA